MLADVASFVHELSGQTLLQRYVSGAIGDADLVAWDSTFGSIGLAQFGVFIATAIIWLIWQHRLVSSVKPLGFGEPYKTPGRSILWWFVPFANLVVVYRIYKDLQAKFDPASGSMVGQWWGAYLLSGAVANVAGRYWLMVETADGFTTGLLLWLVTDALSIVSALVALRLVLRLQAGQTRAIASPPVPSTPIAVLEPVLGSPGPS
jgi:hypothetical protein